MLFFSERDALYISSFAISGLKPVIEVYTAFERGSGFESTLFINSSSVIENGSYLCCVSGIKYSLPGSTSLTELTRSDICFMLSIILLLSSQNMILLCLPISSTYRNFLQRSPISFRCSSSNFITLSSPICDTEIIPQLFKCFLSTMQKVGAVSGDVLFVSVRYISGRLGFTEMVSLFVLRTVLPFSSCVLRFMVSKSSSFSGWAIFVIRPPVIFVSSSSTRLDITIPSSAIYNNLISLFLDMCLQNRYGIL